MVLQELNGRGRTCCHHPMGRRRRGGGGGDREKNNQSRKKMKQNVNEENNTAWKKIIEAQKTRKGKKTEQSQAKRMRVIEDKMKGIKDKNEGAIDDGLDRWKKCCSR